MPIRRYGRPKPRPRPVRPEPKPAEPVMSAYMPDLLQGMQGPVAPPSPTGTASPLMTMSQLMGTPSPVMGGGGNMPSAPPMVPMPPVMGGGGPQPPVFQPPGGGAEPGQGFRYVSPVEHGMNALSKLPGARIKQQQLQSLPGWKQKLWDQDWEGLMRDWQAMYGNAPNPFAEMQAAMNQPQDPDIRY